MSMQGRTFVGSNYKFGYQGSEKETGVNGMYTTDFRGLDVRLGRWMIPDPITHPSQSPYCSMDNDPIGLTDELGLDTGVDECGGNAPNTTSSTNVGGPGGLENVNMNGNGGGDGSAYMAKPTSSTDYSNNTFSGFNFSQNTSTATIPIANPSKLTVSSRSGDAALPTVNNKSSKSNSHQNAKVDDSKHDFTLLYFDRNDPFGINSMNPKPFGWSVLRNTVQYDVGRSISSVLDKKYFYSQVDNDHVPDASWTACFRACKAMINDAGIKGAGQGKEYKMSDDDGNELPDASNAIKVIDQSLYEHKPIILGVNYKKGSGNRDKSTDHFIVIVGKGVDANGIYYTFYDPGVYNTADGVEKGISPNNKLYLKGNLLIGNRYKRSNAKGKYVSSWLRANK